MIHWDLGEWRDCFHMNPADMPEKITNKKMSEYAIKMRRYHIAWGVVNRGNALCLNIFRRKVDAEEYRKKYASAYVVVRVVVTPLYTQTK